MNNGRHPDQLLDLYVDGALDDDRRLAFERAMDADDGLRGAVDRQRAIDDALRRRLGPPPDLRVTVPVVGAPATTGRRPRRARRGWAIAASIAAATLGTWLGWEAIQSRRHAPGPYDRPWQSFEQVYRSASESGMRPEWVCRDDAEFAAHFANRHGQSLLLGGAEDVRALGLSVVHALSPRTMCLLAEVEDRAVIVLVDRLENDRGAALEVGDDLNRFRRRIGRLVAYEITPLESPRVLELLRAPGLDAARVDDPDTEEIEP